MKKIFITIPWFLPAYKAGGPVQSIANMVNQFGNRQLAIDNEFPIAGMEDHGGFEFRIFCGHKDLDGTILSNVEFDKWVSYTRNIRFAGKLLLLSISILSMI